MRKVLVRFIREDEGQDVIEYGLLAAFVSTVAIAAILAVGVDVTTMFNTVDGRLVP